MSKPNKKPMIEFVTPTEAVNYDPKAGAKYGWIITEDYVHGEQPSEAGTIGPRNVSGEIEERLKNKLGQSLRHPDQFVDPSGINKEYAGMTKFRMSDGDGKVYYVGWIDGEYDLTEPLDDFGTPNAGAIYLSTLKADGSWSGTEVEAE